jgi:hypothetical protein
MDPNNSYTEKRGISRNEIMAGLHEIKRGEKSVALLVPLLITNTITT